MENCKLQIGCMLIVLYIMSIYIWERRAYKVGKKERIFGWILVLGMTEIAFDGITAYTVNHLADVPDFLNGILHMIFLCSVDAIVFIMFLYILDSARGLPQSKK